MLAIVDCNSFYCSCEKVFRPDLEQKPVVVLSNNDGCIIARNDEAKELGLGMTGPYFQAKPLIEKYGVEVFSSNYNLYGDLSRRVMETLRHIVGTENVEVYSVDESFVDLTGFPVEILPTLAATIRDTIERWVGIRVSVGIAPTKTLAKMANRYAKKNKEATQCVWLLDTIEKRTYALKNTPVGSIWGIGSRHGEKLASLDIHMAWDLHLMSEEWARKNLGGVVGQRLWRELRGEEGIAMHEPLVNKKMIATTRMFGFTVTELKDIQEAVAAYTTRAAEKLRRQHSAAQVISVFLVSQEKMDGPRFRHGPTASSYTVLSQPSYLTQELIKPAVALATSLFEPGRKYKKAGVTLSSLVPDNAVQASLFEPGRSMGRALMEMMDNINFGMRGDLVKFASAGTGKSWTMRQEFHSPRYTTRWEELFLVK
jgi:DNA polymerase V